MTTCPICQSTRFTEVFTQEKVPACANVPLVPAEFALEVFGELDIVMCEGCSHIFNCKFDVDVINRMYSQNYSSGLPNSEGVRSALRDIAANTIRSTNISDKVVLEIGASDFTFSRIMLEMGAKRVVAFEPSALFHVDDQRIQHVQGYFTPDAVPSDVWPSIDLAVVRHVLEHVPFPPQFVQQLAKKLHQGARLYIEVPNVDNILKDSRVYDFFYEHLHYFSPRLLQEILMKLGFDVERVSELKGGQHFGVLFRKERECPDEIPSLAQEISATRREGIERLKTNTRQLRQTLSTEFTKDSNVAIYGAGNHAIAVTVMLGLASQQVKCLLDLDDLKVGKFSPMSHIEIRKPTVEVVREFDTIVIIAALHQQEIHRHLRERYGFRGRIVGTHPSVRVLD